MYSLKEKLDNVWFRPIWLDNRHQVIEVWHRLTPIATITPPLPQEEDKILLRVNSKHLQNNNNGIFIEPQYDPAALVVRFDPLVEEPKGFPYLKLMDVIERDFH